MLGSLPYATAVVRALVEACADARVRVWTEGEGLAHDDLAREVSDRVSAWPIADRAVLAAAVGAAWGGQRVVLEVGAAQRLQALVEALAAAGRAREGFACTVVVRVAWGGEAGAADRGVLDVLAAIEGLRVVVPRDGAQAAALLRGALAGSGPTVVLEPRVLLRTAAPASTRVADGAAVDVVRPGRQVTVAALGAEVGAAAAVADALAAEGLDVEVVDLVAASPVPADLAARVVATGRLVVVAPPGEAAWARRVVERAVDGAFWYLEAPCAITGIDGLASAIRQTANA